MSVFTDHIFIEDNDRGSLNDSERGGDLMLMNIFVLMRTGRDGRLPRILSFPQVKPLCITTWFSGDQGTRMYVFSHCYLALGLHGIREA